MTTQRFVAKTLPGFSTISGIYDTHTDTFSVNPRNQKPYSFGNEKNLATAVKRANEAYEAEMAQVAKEQPKAPKAKRGMPAKTVQAAPTPAPEMSLKEKRANNAAKARAAKAAKRTAEQVAA